MNAVDISAALAIAIGVAVGSIVAFLLQEVFWGIVRLFNGSKHNSNKPT